MAIATVGVKRRAQRVDTICPRGDRKAQARAGRSGSTIRPRGDRKRGASRAQRVDTICPSALLIDRCPA